MRTFYHAEIVAMAQKYQLDPLLVEAIVVQESAGNTDAFRFERAFWNRYLKPAKLYPGKNPRRISSSYGLMQLMYPVAIERGYSKDDPPERLFVPEIGLDYGCRQLRHLVDWAAAFASVSPEDQRLAVLASYNGGRGGNTPGTSLRNHAYARSVMALYAQLANASPK